jgi:hypothetical protein
MNVEVKATRHILPVIAVAAATVLGIAGCGSSAKTASSAGAGQSRTTTANPATSATSGAPRIQFARQLISTPFSAGSIPAGFQLESTAYSNPKPNATEVAIRFRPPGNPPVVDMIFYGLLLTDGDAKAIFDAGPTAISSPANHTVLSTQDQSQLGHPARLFTEHVSGDNGTCDGRGNNYCSYSYCTILIGDTLVSGASGVPGFLPSGNSNLACELARDGVQHLNATNADH